MQNKNETNKNSKILENKNYEMENKYENDIIRFKREIENKNNIIKNLQENNKKILVEKDSNNLEYIKQIDDLKQKLSNQAGEINKLINDNQNNRLSYKISYNNNNS